MVRQVGDRRGHLPRGGCPIRDLGGVVVISNLGGCKGSVFVGLVWFLFCLVWFGWFGWSVSGLVRLAEVVLKPRGCLEGVCC